MPKKTEIVDFFFDVRDYDRLLIQATKPTFARIKRISGIKFVGREKKINGVLRRSATRRRLIPIPLLEGRRVK